MKVNFKRIMAVILSVCMMALLFTGCKGKSGKVVLKWGFSGALGCKDDDLVHKEFNKKLNELMPGVQVEFIDQSTSNWSLWMNAGDQVDIAWSGYEYDVESEIIKGAYSELDGLINEKDTPNIYQEMKDYPEDYYSGTYKDKLYMLPIQQPIFTQSARLDIPAELYQYMNVDALLNAAHSSAKTTRAVYDEITKFLEKVWAANAYDTDTIGNGIDVITLGKILSKRGYDFVGAQSFNGANLCYDAFDDNAQLVNFAETDAYKLFLEYAGKWYNAGYIPEDVLTSSGGGTRSAVISANASGMWYGTDNPETGEARGVSYIMNNGKIGSYGLLLDTTEQQFNGTSTLGSEATYQVIPITAKYPEEAIKLLDLMRSPVGTPGNDLANLLCYGFEKNSDYAKKYDTYHYTLNGTCAQGVDYTVQPSSNCKYGKCFWTVTNTYLLYHTPVILDGQSEWALDFEKNVRPTLHKTPYYRFRADFSSMLTDVSNISSVTKEFNDQLLSGLNGSKWITPYEQMMKKMKDAKLENVKSEIQKQMKAYKPQ